MSVFLDTSPHTTAFEMKEGDIAWCRGPGSFNFLRKGERVDIYLLGNLPLRKSPHEDGESIQVTRRRILVEVPKDREQKVRDLLATEESRGFMQSLPDELGVFPVVFV